MSSEPADALGEQHDHEQHRRDDEPVLDRLHQRALGARRGVVGGEDAERDEAELGDRRVAEDQPRVGLRERHHRAVEDRQHGEHEQDRLEVVHGVREQRQRHAQEAVGGDLGDHAGEHGQRGQRHRAVGVGHPAVERERRHLDQEREREGGEDPLLRALGQPVGDEVREREAQLGRPARRQHGGRRRGGQHQQRADERVDDHLHGRRDAVGAAPDPDQEVERHQHQVEEEDEDAEVLRQERAQHGRLGDPEVQRELRGARRRAQDQPQRRGREQQRRQRHQPEVEPVDAEPVVDAEVRDPLVVGQVLQPARGRVEVEQHQDRVAERHERADERERRRRGARHERAGHAEHQRPEDEDAQVDRHAEIRK